MEFTFQAATEQSVPRLRALILDEGAIPSDLEPAILKGAEATRFAGKCGQIFEIFVERDGQLVRLARAGAGKTAFPRWNVPAPALPHAS